MISTRIQLRGGPADGAVHEVTGRVVVGREIHLAGQDAGQGSHDHLAASAVYLVAAVQSGPVFDPPGLLALDARADYVGRG